MKSPFDKESERLLNRLSELDPNSDEYEKVATNLKVLREAEGKVLKPGVDSKFLIGIASELVFTLLVLNFERFGIITSKAFRRIKFG